MSRKAVRLAWGMISISLSNMLPRIHVLNGVRCSLLRAAGMKIGENTHIIGKLSLDSSLKIETATGISIGNQTFINDEIRFASRGSRISIGNRCMIGARVIFETASHNTEFRNPYGDRSELRSTYFAPIRINDGVWIGSGAIILQGVVVGEGSIVAAGSVVNKSVEPGVIVGGAPARVLKRLYAANAAPTAKAH